VPRKVYTKTPFGAEIHPQALYVVRVAYHPTETFATDNRRLMEDMVEAFRRQGWTPHVEIFDWHKVPEAARTNGKR
jgi:hypothetical protein